VCVCFLGFCVCICECMYGGVSVCMVFGCFCLCVVCVVS